MKTVIYTYTAVENKATLEKQLKQCREYCHTNGLNVVVEVQEFGYIPARPGLAELCRLIEAREVKTVVVTSIDRLGRCIDQVIQLVKKIEQAGVVLKLAK